MTGLPGLLGGDNMEGGEPEDSGKKLDEEDEWQLYASAGYASSESENEDIQTELDQEEIWFDGDDFDFEGSTVNWDSPPCPLHSGLLM